MPRRGGLARQATMHTLGMHQTFDYCGVPRTAEEWAALAKIASGHSNLSRDELRRLFMLGLVERQLGRICLSRHGRTILGRWYRRAPPAP